MVTGKIENDPNDGFADSWGAQNVPFTVTLMCLSFIVTLLYLVWLIVDAHWSRKGLVVANVVLFISAIMMVIGGDMVMIIDIFLSVYFGYETHKYMVAHE